jgi:hypothetical protein
MEAGILTIDDIAAEKEINDWQRKNEDGKRETKRFVTAFMKQRQTKQTGKRKNVLGFR